MFTIDPASQPTTRLPLEHATALDVICTQFSPDETVFVATKSPALVQAAALRHPTCVTNVPHRRSYLDTQFPDLTFAPLPTAVHDVVVILEPETPGIVERLVGETRPARVECLAGNPYSFNQVEDRTLDEWCSPLALRRALRATGYDVEIVGYHGPRSIAQSFFGKLYDIRGRRSKRDVHTHRMRAAYRESFAPSALLSCLVHLRGDRRA